MNKSTRKILSVYLSSKDITPANFEHLSSQLHSLIHNNLTEEQRNKLQKEIVKIEDYLRQNLYRENARSYVFFAGNNYWKVENFNFFLNPLCKVTGKPYLDPLKKIKQKYKKYLVLLADREKAKIFTVHLGKIEEQMDIFDNTVPQNVKAKKIDYGRDDKIFRHIEQHLSWHFELIAKRIKEFTTGKNINFIILGGHKEIISKLKFYLPYPLNKMVLGEFVTELNIPINKVLDKSKKVASKIQIKKSSRNKNKLLIAILP